MAQSEDGNSIAIDWETGGAIKINLAVHGWYLPPLRGGVLLSQTV
jgi:hypothetical protein